MLINFLIFLFFIFFLVLAKFRLDLAVMVLIIALPSYSVRFKIFGLPTTLLELMIGFVFLIWLIFHTEFKNYLLKKERLERFRENRKKRTAYPFGWEIILLLIIAFFASAVSGFSDSSLGIWKAYFFEPILLFIVVLNVFKGRDGMGKILWALFLSALAVSFMAIFQKFTGTFIFNEFWAETETRRATSFFGYPNAIGLYLAPIVLVLMGWLIDKVRKLQITNYKLQINLKLQVFEIVFLIFISFFSILSIYFAKSEGALIAVLAGLIIFGLLLGRKWRIATMIFIFIFGISMFFYQPVSPWLQRGEPIKEYVINKATLRDLSGEIRKQQWRETWQMLKDGRFFSGAGLANYQDVIMPYHQEGIFFNKDNDPEFHRHVVWNEEYKKAHWQPVEIYLYPHNIFLNFWSELGLAGAILFIWIMGKFFYLGFKNYKFSKKDYVNIGLIGAMAVIVVHGLVDVPYFKNDLSVMFWIFIATISMINLELKTEKEKL